MVTLERAQEIVREHVVALPAELVALESSLGRVLAEPVIADTHVPPFARAAMDGFALHESDVASASTTLEIAGEARAGRAWEAALQPGHVVRIMTGAPVPAAARAVVPVEETRLAKDGAWVEILSLASPGQNIAPAGSEAREGDELLAAGQVIDAATIAVLALAGKDQVRVGRRPELALLVSGDELRPLTERPTGASIRDTNGPTLRALAIVTGARLLDLGRVGDDPDQAERVLRRGLAADVLVATGGVSAGDHDYVKPAVKRLGVNVLFEAVAVKPGKPVVFGTREGTLVFGLPGNPVSAQVAFALFVAPALLGLQGCRPRPYPRIDVVLDAPLRNRAQRVALLPARIEHRDGLLRATGLPSKGSADVVRHALADGLIEMAPGREAQAGETVGAIVLGPLWRMGGPW